MSLIAAFAVPPVASTSSTMTTESPGLTASRCASNTSVPYSNAYSSRTTSQGNFPALRTGTNPAPKWKATGAARIKPRASIPTTLSIFKPCDIATMEFTASVNPCGSPMSGVISRKVTPGAGTSSILRMYLCKESLCINHRRVFLRGRGGCDNTAVTASTGLAFAPVASAPERADCLRETDEPVCIKVVMSAFNER